LLGKLAGDPELTFGSVPSTSVRGDETGGLEQRMIVSIRALSNASPTLPIEGRMPSRVKMLGEPDETSDAVRVSKPRGLWLVEHCGFRIEDACAEAVV
jgi:hypothetical protein